MPRQQGLRPIGDSIKKIIERIKKEREERRKKNTPIKSDVSRVKNSIFFSLESIRKIFTIKDKPSDYYNSTKCKH